MSGPAASLDMGVIGGTGLYDPDLLEAPRAVAVATPYGEVVVHVGGLAGRRVGFLPRHGAGHAIPPHRVNYRANVWALHRLGAQRLLGTAASGALRASLPPGTVVLPDQFLDFTHRRDSTFFEGGEAGVVHTDMTEPYCPELRRLIASAAAERGIGCVDGGTYVCTEGPRFETPAEIRMYAQLGGDIVGMTGVPEVVLARELGACYVAVGVATNFAAGLAGRPLTHAEVVEVMERNGRVLRQLVGDLVARLPAAHGCRCAPPPPP